MAETPTPEELALWQKRLASRANNRAWTLAELLQRSAEEDEEMLHAAHAAMYFWNLIGTPRNQAHAAQLLAHVYALLKRPEPAGHYLSKSLPYFLQNDCSPGELAFAHAVAANVASAKGNAEEHARHYAQARAISAQLASAQERELLGATLRVIPVAGS